jgi:hypothetical protein
MIIIESREETNGTHYSFYFYAYVKIFHNNFCLYFRKLKLSSSLGLPWAGDCGGKGMVPFLHCLTPFLPTVPERQELPYFLILCPSDIQRILLRVGMDLI